MSQDSQLSPLDPSNFRQFIVDSPTQFKTGFEIAKDIKLDGTFDKVTLSGMGGSALPGNLFRIYLNDIFSKNHEYKPLPIYQNRFYKLPPEAYKNSINFIASYSGNTEETLSAFKEAHEAELPCVGFSSGGKLEELCKEWGVPHVKLPMPTPDFQPRMGTGYLFASMFQVLVNLGLVPDTTQEILSMAENLQSSLGSYEERGKVLAQKISGKTPVVYASSMYKAVAMVWKIKINENAKTPAFYNFFPELDHNEMIGYTNPQGKFIAIMLRDPQDHERNLLRYDATAKLIMEKGVDAEIIEMEGNSVFEKIFKTVLLGDFMSYYLALAYNQDPTPVDMVEKIKEILAS